MKIAIFGGTFDPPHLGHERLIQNIKKKIKPDKVIVIPAYISPFKTGKTGTAAAADRLAMCRLAFGRKRGVEISDIEISRGGNSYSYDTITELSRIYPDDELCMIIGSDQLLAFRKWYMYGEILKKCTLVVLSRLEKPEAELEAEVQKLRCDCRADIILLYEKPVEASSTAVRGGRLDLVSKSVANYIRTHGLYTDK